MHYEAHCVLPMIVAHQLQILSCHQFLDNIGHLQLGALYEGTYTMQQRHLFTMGAWIMPDRFSLRSERIE